MHGVLYTRTWLEETAYHARYYRCGRRRSPGGHPCRRFPSHGSGNPGRRGRCHCGALLRAGSLCSDGSRCPHELCARAASAAAAPLARQSRARRHHRGRARLLRDPRHRRADRQPAGASDRESAPIPDQHHREGPFASGYDDRQRRYRACRDDAERSRQRIRHARGQDSTPGNEPACRPRPRYPATAGSGRNPLIRSDPIRGHSADRRTTAATLGDGRHRHRLCDLFPAAETRPARTVSFGWPGRAIFGARPRRWTTPPGA